MAATISKGIMDAKLNRIVEGILAVVRPEKIVLFGSRARGNARPDSDYDILVVYDGPLSKREVKVGVHRQLFPPAFGLDMFVLKSAELAEYAGVSNTLAREAALRGKVVYEQ